MNFININVDNKIIELPLTTKTLFVGKSSKGKTNFCKKICGLVPSKMLMNGQIIDDFSKYKYFNSDYLFISSYLSEEINEDDMFMFNDNINPNSLKLIDKLKLFILSIKDNDDSIIIFDNVFDLLDRNNKKYIINLIDKYLSDKAIIITSNNLESYKLFDKIFLLSDDITDISNIYDCSDLLDDEQVRLPFLMDLSKKLSFYNLLDKNYDNALEMVGELWK